MILILTNKVDNYKKQLINHYKPFVLKGQLTAWEVEFIAEGAIIEALGDERTRKLFMEDKHV